MLIIAPCAKLWYNKMMNKPQIGNALTEGVPNALEATLNYVPKTAEKASKEIQGISLGVSQAVKGVLKGTGRVLDFLGRKVLWQDVAALPKTAAVGWYHNLKAMTVDTVKHSWKRRWKQAGKTFLGGLVGAGVVTPLKSVWKGLKGAVNIPFRAAYAPVEAVKVAGDVSGLTFENGALSTKSYGFIPALKSIFKGSVGVATAPLYPIGNLSTHSGWSQKFMQGDLALNTSPLNQPAANQAPSAAPVARPTPPPVSPTAPAPTPPATPRPAPGPRPAPPATPRPAPGPRPAPPAAPPAAAA
jgi:hypothetical protein